MKRKSIATLLMLMIFLLSGCGKSDVSFVWYTDASIKTLDPQLASSSAEISSVRQLFSGLYRLDGEGNAVLDGATAVSVSTDGLQYTFTLNSANVFTDGKDISIPVTAEDYVFGLQRVVTPSTNSPYAKNFLCIAGARDILEHGADPATLGVRALDDTTLQITLTSRDDGLLAKLAGSGAMPCNRTFFENAAGAYGLSKATIIGNGPFYLSGWSESAGITLRRTGKAASGAVTRVRLVPEDGEKTAAERLNEGNQDMALASNADEEQTLLAKGFTGSRFESGTAALLFNCADRYLSNPSVRSALAGWATESAQGYTENTAFTDATGLVPGSITLNGVAYRTGAGDVRTSLSAAQRYASYQLGLTELGTSKLSGITVLVPNEESYLALYRAVNQSWQRELGAFFSIEQLDLPQLRARVASGDYDIALVPFSATENDPAALLSAFVSTDTANQCNYANTAYDALVKLAYLETGNAQLSSYAAAERLLLSDAPVVPLKFVSSSIYISPSISGIVLDPFGPVFDVTNAKFQ